MDFKFEEGLIYLGEETNPDAYIEYNKFERDGETILNCAHTVVDPSMGGQGIGSKLAEAFFNYARENGYKVQSTCSFTHKKLIEGDNDDIKA